MASYDVSTFAVAIIVDINRKNTNLTIFIIAFNFNFEKISTKIFTSMLSCNNLSVLTSDGKSILNNASVGFKPKAMNAVIGPSGCGKTTLIKAMLKIIDSSGDSYFCGQKIQGSEDLVGKVGFAPQFTCAHTMLSVGEVVKNALDFSIQSIRVDATVFCSSNVNSGNIGSETTSSVFFSVTGNIPFVNPR